MNPLFYHNPRCSKSRQALQLLAEHGVDAEVIRYLEDPPDLEALRAIAAALDEPARALVRPQEAAWKEAGVDPATLDDEGLLAFASMHPSVLQRPLLVVGDRARIGRPPERLLEILPR